MKTPATRLISLAILSIFLTLSLISGAEAKAKKEKVVKDKAETKSSAAEKSSKEELLARAQKEIDNTAWVIAVKHLGDNKQAKTTSDTLIFLNSRMDSGALKKEGFSPSNFTLTLKGENIVIWETMQSSSDKGIALWKGEMEGGAMRGVLSRRMPNQVVRDYTFISVKKEVIPEAEKKRMQEQETAVVETAKKPVAETKKQ